MANQTLVLTIMITDTRWLDFVSRMGDRFAETPKFEIASHELCEMFGFEPPFWKELNDRARNASLPFTFNGGRWHSDVEPGLILFSPLGTRDRGTSNAMTRDRFYQVLLVALGHAKFDLNVSAIKMLDSTKWLPQPLLSPIQLTNVQGAAKADQLAKEFDSMTPYTQLIAFRFFLGQPFIACAVEGDGRSPDEYKQISATFAQCIRNCTSYTLQPHGVVSGFLLFIFFDSIAAKTFVSTTQQACRYRDTRTMTSVRPWSIDVAGRHVVPEQKRWTNRFGTLKPDQLAKDLFANEV